ncbi:MAG: hypothetical protein AB2A00_12675 [Myxococcota bacterium]
MRLGLSGLFAPSVLVTLACSGANSDEDDRDRKRSQGSSSSSSSSGASTTAAEGSSSSTTSSTSSSAGSSTSTVSASSSSSGQHRSSSASATPPSSAGSGDDLTAPLVLAIDISPTEVDTDESWATVTFHLHVVDDLSGLCVACTSERNSVAVRGPDGTVLRAFYGGLLAVQ